MVRMAFCTVFDTFYGADGILHAWQITSATFSAAADRGWPVAERCGVWPVADSRGIIGPSTNLFWHMPVKTSDIEYWPVAELAAKGTQTLTATPLRPVGSLGHMSVWRKSTSSPPRRSAGGTMHRRGAPLAGVGITPCQPRLAIPSCPGSCAGLHMASGAPPRNVDESIPPCLTYLLHCVLSLP